MTTKTSTASRIVKALTMAGAAACVALSGSVSAAEVNVTRTIEPGSGMSFQVGSKRAMTFFNADGGACNVTLMVGEADSLYVPAARVQVALMPGKATRLDSGEGDIMNVVCNEGAKSVSISFPKLPNRWARS